MVTYEDECVGCPAEIGCLGSSCPYKNVRHLYCDICGFEVDKLYKINGDEICEKCLAKEYEVIE